MLDGIPHTSERGDARLGTRAIRCAGIVGIGSRYQHARDFLYGAVRGKHRLQLREQRPDKVAHDLGVVLQRRMVGTGRHARER